MVARSSGETEARLEIAFFYDQHKKTVRKFFSHCLFLLYYDLIHSYCSIAAKSVSGLVVGKMRMRLRESSPSAALATPSLVVTPSL